MAKIEFREKFPCGYEIEINIDSLFITSYTPDEETECPLHGKNCPPK